ncbi:hypothetical protein PHSC3_000292 [Chlamydiales bacterium STE3]|nr:hypothetical protein PHSC3_000292 [Chlamydiales bacterium STE3]
MKERVVEFLDRIFAVVGAFFFSQIPQFYQQYTTLLAGHLAELNFQIELMENAAKSTGKTLTQLIQKFLASTDVDFHNQGVLMNTTFERWSSFNEAMLALKNASFFNRPFVFSKHFNWQVFKETIEQFTIGFSFTPESILYGIVGIFFGYLLFQLLSRGLFRLKKVSSESKTTHS